MTRSRERRQNRIDPGEILDLGEYERRRDEIRPGAMAARSLRRVEVGPNATLSFENGETVRYQIHEMLRAERIAKPSEVMHEIETYSDLLPASSELSATLLLEFPEPAQRAVWLAKLVGLDTHLHLEIEGAGRSTASFDRRQVDEDKISSVQFVRFPLDPAQRDGMLAGKGARVVIDHPAYQHARRLAPEQVTALAADLREADDRER